MKQCDAVCQARARASMQQEVDLIKASLDQKSHIPHGEAVGEDMRRPIRQLEEDVTPAHVPCYYRCDQAAEGGNPLGNLRRGLVLQRADARALCRLRSRDVRRNSSSFMANPSMWRASCSQAVGELAMGSSTRVPNLEE